jgi:hypothetical protein
MTRYVEGKPEDPVFFAVFTYSPGFTGKTGLSGPFFCNNNGYPIC